MGKARYIEQLNPLRGLTPQQVVGLLEAGMRGELTLLQWVYYTIEQHDPDLVALVERRTSAVTELDWDVRTAERTAAEGARRTPGEAAPGAVALNRAPAAGVAERQAQALKAAYERLDNLQAAIRHLAMASFRGYSVCQLQDAAGRPAAPGAAVRVACLDPWCFVRDGRRGAWGWNPEAVQTTYAATPEERRLDPARDCLIIREVERPIDRVALVKFVRSGYAQKAWAEFIERAAENGVIVTMPTEIPAGKEGEYLDAAEAVSNGRRSALPGGSEVTFANERAGEPPFEAHLRWLREQLVMAGTGGLLTMLAQPQGIGAGASREHGDAFRAIAQAEARDIAEAFQIGFDRPLLAARFAGAEAGAYFALSAVEQEDQESLARQAQTLGAVFELDPEEWSERTGFTLEARSVAPALPPGLPPALPRVSLNKEGGAESAEAARAELAAAGARAEERARAEALAGWFARLEALAGLGLEPGEFLRRLDELTAELPADALTRAAVREMAAAREGALGAAAANALAEELR